MRIQCAKCLEILEVTDEYKICSCHLVLIRAKTTEATEGEDDWKSRVVGRPADIIFLDESNENE